MAGTNDTNSNATLIEEIHIPSIYLPGKTGLYYDIRTSRWNPCEQIANFDVQLLTNHHDIQCTVTKWSKTESTNLIQFIPMNDIVRLNILVFRSLRIGIGEIANHFRMTDKYTRLFYYKHVFRKMKYRTGSNTAKEYLKLLKPRQTDTHALAGIYYGIEMCVVLQLPRNEVITSNIDDILVDICSRLKDGKDAHEIIKNNENLLQQITIINVYSNIANLMKFNEIKMIYSYIKNDWTNSLDSPVMYSLQSIRSIFPNFNAKGQSQFVQLTPKAIENVETHCIMIENQINLLKTHVESLEATSLNERFEKQISSSKNEWLKINKLYKSFMKTVEDRVITAQTSTKLSPNNLSEHTLKDLGNENSYKVLNERIADLTKQNKLLEEMEQFIVRIENIGFKYYNAANAPIFQNSNRLTMIRKLYQANGNARMLCSDDGLNKANKAEFQKHIDTLLEERSIHRNRQIIYVDFSYCKYKLQRIEIIDPPDTKSLTSEKTSKQNKPIELKKSLTQSNKSSQVLDDTINILLIGESGVGKSTFINAFVNYLTYNTFEKAHSKPPVVLTPVSFTITTGHQFKERLVKFGDFDCNDNEDFDHPGESVTQRCKSHLFYIPDDTNDNSKLQVRIIDTPGFGDTRGYDQDDLNMQDILGYISNLTHLNAVCFLLKPNSSNIHAFFSVCLNQLVHHLGLGVCENIIFCFTNARSTFFSPGDTAPLLRNILSSFTLAKIPFTKHNAYCFDNEAFRYLIALQNNVTFEDDERCEYEKSWSKSVEESNRLIQFICETLKPCCIDNSQVSEKSAQVQINRIIRPMLETLRFLLRNGILLKAGTINKSLKLIIKPLFRPARKCLSCKPYPVQYDRIRIVDEISHEFLKTCLTCDCPPNDHIPINYVLRYQCVNEDFHYSGNQLQKIVKDICQIGAEFDYFLKNIAHSSKKKPFLSRLDDILSEEIDLFEDETMGTLNAALIQDINESQNEYKRRFTQLESNRDKRDAKDILRMIEHLNRCDEIRQQLEVMKETQRLTTELFEISKV